MNHPDRFAGNEKLRLHAEEQCKRINEARDVLLSGRYQVNCAQSQSKVVKRVVVTRTKQDVDRLAKQRILVFGISFDDMDDRHIRNSINWCKQEDRMWKHENMIRALRQELSMRGR